MFDKGREVFMKKILLAMGSVLLASGCMATVTPGGTRVSYLVPTAPIRQHAPVYVQRVRPLPLVEPHHAKPPYKPHQAGPAIVRHHHPHQKAVPVHVPGAATRNSPQLRFW